MPFAHVQDAGKFEGAATTSHSLAWGTAPTTGNLLIAMALGGLSLTYSSVADTYGNAWTSIGNYSPTDITGEMQIWACVNRGGSGTDTFSFTTASEQLEIWVAEFSGEASPLAQDGVVATAQATTGTAITTPSYTPTVSGDLLISLVQAANNVSTINSPWTQANITTNGDGWGYILNHSGTTAQAAAATGAASGAWASIIVAIEPATSGGAASTPDALVVPQTAVMVPTGWW